MGKLQGIRAHSNGASMEAMIDAGCVWYDYKGLASIHKVPEPMRVIQNLGKGKFVSVFREKALPDYEGTMRGGRSILFEAKHSDGDEISRGRVTQKQWEKLDSASELGALCYVLISFGFRVFSMIPWALWKDMKNQVGRLHLKPTDEIVQVHRVSTSGKVIMFLDNFARYIE